MKMMKRIMSILALIIVFGGLIWGGVNYTSAKLGFENSENSTEAEYQELSSEELIEKIAVVEKVIADEWTLLLEDGSELIIEGRSLTYAIQKGFIPSEGDKLLLTGFEDEQGTYEIAEIKNLTRQAGLLLRNAYGQPLWGRGSGNGGKGGGGGD